MADDKRIEAIKHYYDKLRAEAQAKAEVLIAEISVKEQYEIKNYYDDKNNK